jgi:hypothetical protein
MYNKKSYSNFFVLLCVGYKEDKNMIKLQLLDACEKCPKFIAKSEHVGDITSGFESEPVYYVTCENHERCSTMLNYLRMEEKKNGNKEK